MKRYIIPVLAAALTLSATACNEADKFEYGNEGILITGTDASPIASSLLTADNVPVTYPFSVSATGKVDNDVTVTVAYDAAALTAYNAKNGTSYVAVPEEALSFESKTLTIAEGTAISAMSSVTLVSNAFIEDGVIYMIPITVVDVKGADLDIIEPSKTIFIRLAKTQLNPSLDITNTSVYSTYSLGKGYELDTWTLEIKAHPYNMKSRGAEQLCRLACWNEDNGGQVLLRFNENGKPWKTLDIVAPNGRYVTGATGEGDAATGSFEENTWYMISIVWDGAEMKVYINGELDSPWQNTISGNQAFNLNRFEIGMSWGGYGSSQSYTGRMAEMRIWNVARSKSEIAETLCSVDVMSEGLLGYWRMNEGSGHIFKDSARWTADGSEKTDIKDMNWDQSERQADESNYTNTGAGNAVSWVKDEKNACAQ